jgi:hypothetical protein
MNGKRLRVAGGLLVFACLLCRPCFADTEDYTTQEYTDFNGVTRDMWVQASVLNPTNDQQFWAVAGVADTCYDEEISGNWSYGAYSSTGSPDDYNCQGSADTYQNGGIHWADEAHVNREIFMPIGPTFDYDTDYYNTTDSFLGSNQQQYGGIWYYLQGVTYEGDDTYYPGFSALVGAQNWFNCACACP